MAITVKQVSTPFGANSTAVSTSFGAACSAGNGIVVMMRTAAAPASVTDNVGNTYTQARLQNQFGIMHAVYHCLNPASGPTTVTVNFGSSTLVNVVLAVEVYGQLTQNAINGTGANATTQTAGAITTTVANTIDFIGVSTSNAPTVPSGYTNLFGDNSARMTYRVYTATQTGLNPSWTVSVGNQYAAIQVAYTSTNTTGPTVDVSLADTLTWTGTELLASVDAFTADTLTWSYSFSATSVEVALDDTLTWGDVLGVSSSSDATDDTLTWSQTFDGFIGETMEDTLTWGESFAIEIVTMVTDTITWTPRLRVVEDGDVEDVLTFSDQTEALPDIDRLSTDLLIWSEQFGYDLNLADGIGWMDRFMYDGEVFPDLLAEWADTLTWDMRSIEALILFDSMTWADNFNLPVQTVLLEDTLSWSAFTEADPNLLGAARYRR